MTDQLDLEAILAGARVDPAVFALRPDYRVMLLAADGIAPTPSDSGTEALLTSAERVAAEALESGPLEELPHVASWRDAYRSFGAKPQRTRNSLEALMRRADKGLPRVNRLTDVYNALSVIHQVPIGGEDLRAYAGTPQLIRAAGTEPFDTTASGEPVTEHPEAGEVVWCDDAGVTCRRWNWRQCRRTGLQDTTTAALFILDALDPLTDSALQSLTDDLRARLTTFGPQVRFATRLIANH